MSEPVRTGVVGAGGLGFHHIRILRDMLGTLRHLHGLAPGQPVESALDRTLNPGAYTVILRGVNDAAGVGLVEVFDLTPAP